MMHQALKTAVLLLFLSSSVGAQAPDRPTIFLVRHAERADTGRGGPPAMTPGDPDLSDAGRRRAESLAFALKGTAIRTIFVTEFKRTQQTAAPVAEQAGVTPTKMAADRVAELVTKLENDAGSGNILVVGHSNTVPEIIKSLGVTTPVTIAESEYDDLFIVTQAGTSRRLIHLHYR